MCFSVSFPRSKLCSMAVGIHDSTLVWEGEGELTSSEKIENKIPKHWNDFASVPCFNRLCTNCCCQLIKSVWPGQGSPRSPCRSERCSLCRNVRFLVQQLTRWQGADISMPAGVPTSSVLSSPCAKASGMLKSAAHNPEAKMGFVVAVFFLLLVALAASLKPELLLKQMSWVCSSAVVPLRAALWSLCHPIGLCSPWHLNAGSKCIFPSQHILSVFPNCCNQYTT